MTKYSLKRVIWKIGIPKHVMDFTLKYLTLFNELHQNFWQVKKAQNHTRKCK